MTPVSRRLLSVLYCNERDGGYNGSKYILSPHFTISERTTTRNFYSYYLDNKKRSIWLRFRRLLDLALHFDYRNKIVLNSNRSEPLNTLRTEHSNLIEQYSTVSNTNLKVIIESWHLQDWISSPPYCNDFGFVNPYHVPVQQESNKYRTIRYWFILLLWCNLATMSIEMVNQHNIAWACIIQMQWACVKWKCFLIPVDI